MYRGHQRVDNRRVMRRGLCRGIRYRHWSRSSDARRSFPEQRSRGNRRLLLIGALGFVNHMYSRDRNQQFLNFGNYQVKGFQALNLYGLFLMNASIQFH